MNIGDIKIISMREKFYLPKSYSKIRVDRKNPILGNPHRMRNQSNEERNRVIQLFRQDVISSRNILGPLWSEIVSLAVRVSLGENIALLCWCCPKSCHADIIKEYILLILEQDTI